jgi:hypothetical protein
LAETTTRTHLQSLYPTTPRGFLYSARNCKTLGLENQHDRKTHQGYDEKQKARDAEAPIPNCDKNKTIHSPATNIQNPTHKAP